MSAIAPGERDGDEEFRPGSLSHPGIDQGGNNGFASPPSSFEVYVSKDTFKFNAAHFVAFRGYRERLHGHNYRVGVRVLGRRDRIGPDGYVIDFGCIKDVCKRVCKSLNERFLCPMYSDVIDIIAGDESDGSVKLICEDESVFLFPLADCVMLPIVHATTEELAIYLWGEILNGLNAEYLAQRGIHTMEVTVAEAIGQEATFRYQIPSRPGDNGNRGENSSVAGNFRLDVRKFVEKGEVVPMPCQDTRGIPDGSKSKINGKNGNATPAGSATSCPCPGCAQSKEKFTEQLERIAEAINSGTILSLQPGNDQNQNSSGGDKKITATDLEALLSQTS